MHPVLALTLIGVLTNHFGQDVALWLVFFSGQAIYLLKRAGNAIRSKSNPTKTRGQYIYHNWDIISIRAIVAMVVIYIPWRHMNLAEIVGMFHVTIPMSLDFLVGLSSGAAGAWALGYAADSILDWVSLWPKTPEWVRRWLKEQIPTLPPNGNGNGTGDGNAH